MKQRPAVSIAFSDVHAPKQDPASWACFLDAVRQIRKKMNLVSVVCLGDLIDLASVTHHELSPDDGGATLKKELRAGMLCLDQVAKAAGPVKKIMVEGNHEYRIPRYVASGACPRALTDAVPKSVYDGLQLKKRGWQYIGRDQQPYMWRGILLHHGYWYGRHHAAKQVDELGHDNIYGHTHRPQTFTRTSVKGSMTAVGLPCLRKLERDWEHMKKRPFSGWTSGFAVLCHDGGRTSAYNVLIENGRAAWGGLIFDAKN